MLFRNALIWVVVFYFLGLTFTASAATPLQLTEICAESQGDILTDLDGDGSDWLEIHNSGAVALNLSGYFLSAETTIPAQWKFPAISIPAKGYLVVYASGKNRTNATTELHTNFKLSDEKGDVLLVDKDGKTILAGIRSYPIQYSGISYGYDATGKLLYLPKPTPRAANGMGVPDFVKPVQFSHEPGFYETSFNLHLASDTLAAEIRYTTNGSLPSLTNGFAYTSPISISGTMTVRTLATKAGLGKSLSTTRTFLYLKDVLVQTGLGFPPLWGNIPGDYMMDPTVLNNPLYLNSIRQDLLSLPIMSVVMDTNDLWGASGIYSNSQQEGDNWERPGSLELIYLDGKPGFQVNCGFRMHGGASRDPVHTEKHTFRALFKGNYGYNKLSFPLYEGSPVQEFDTLVLRSTFNDGWAWAAVVWPGSNDKIPQYLRDPFTRNSQAATGNAASHSKFVHLYVNGLYWGLYNPSEKTAGAFGASYFGGSKPQYDAINTGAAVDGDMKAYNLMMSKAGAGLASQAQYTAIQDYLDVPSFIDYMIVNLFVGNTDWPANNWSAVRKRLPKAGFRYLIWDAEWSFGAPDVNVVGVSAAGTPAFLYSQLRGNAEFRLLFADHLHRHFFNNGSFTPALTVERYGALAREIDRAIVGESARWGDARRVPAYTRDVEWTFERDRILTNYLSARSAIVLQQFKAINLYPELQAPGFSQHGGRVSRDSEVTLAAGPGAIYYTTNGMDPRVPFTGSISPSAIKYSAGTPVRLTKTTALKARTLQGTVWSALNEAVFQVGEIGIPLRITEIMYHPTGGRAYEYLEVQNTGTVPIDLSGFYFDGISFMFPYRTLLTPGQTLLLASDYSPPSFSQRYPKTTVFSYFGGSLNNNGEGLRIMNPQGVPVTHVSFKDSPPWPGLTDGTGFSLEMIDPLGDPNDPTNWRASVILLGTPGTNTTTISPIVVINEFMADNMGSVSNGDKNPDWIELMNSGTAKADISGWTLSDESSSKFTFPVGTILNPGAFLVVWCDEDFSLPGLHTGFSLGKKEDSILLSDFNGRRMDGISFGEQLPDLSAGRIESKWTLTEPTPGSANKAKSVAAQSSISLNEWLPHPLTGNKEWIELFNRDASLPVELKGLYLETGSRSARIHPLSFLPPKGFIRIWLDSEIGADHILLDLPNSGGQLRLLDASAKELESVSFGITRSGSSQGHLPDGASAIVDFSDTPSPGSPNYLLPQNGLVINEVLAKNDSAVANGEGVYADYVELLNTGSSILDLSGFSLNFGDASPGKFVLPAGTRVPPNSYLVLWCDKEIATSTKSGPVIYVNQPVSGSGDVIYLFNVQHQIVDLIRFGPQVQNKSIGRSPVGWNLLQQPTPGVANGTPMALGAPTTLRINEWQAHDNDWFELYNSSSNPVALTGLFLTDDASLNAKSKFKFGALSFIGPSDFAKFNATGKQQEFGNEVNFTLESTGETIHLYTTNLTLLDAVDFPAQSQGSSGRLPDGGVAVVHFPTTPTPGESNYLPLPLTINEILNNPGKSQEQAIEFYNPEINPINLDGWYLSNDPKQFKKWKIPTGNTIASKGFKVFYQNTFGSGANKVTLLPWESGTLYLSQVNSEDALTGYRAQLSYFPSETGISWGHFDVENKTHFVPLSTTSFGVSLPGTVEEFRTGRGAKNSTPKTGPIIIREVHYNTDPDLEFVEIFNTGPLPSSLQHWQIRGGATFNFQLDLTLPSHGHLLLVSFDPTKNPLKLQSFQKHFRAPRSALIAGPFEGRLNDSGDSVRLLKPLTQAPITPTPHYPVDRVDYLPTAPWPLLAGDQETSLQRKVDTTFGNDPANWISGIPTPGGDAETDSDGDGMPDDWETFYRFSPQDPTNATLDVDGDGHSNLMEYQAGTDPRVASSVLKLSIGNLSGKTRVSFDAAEGKSYTILSSTSLAPQNWTPRFSAGSGPARKMEFEEFEAGTARFYRLTVISPSE